MLFTCAKNHWMLPMHSNDTSKNVSGFTLAGPPCMYRSHPSHPRIPAASQSLQLPLHPALSYRLAAAAAAFNKTCCALCCWRWHRCSVLTSVSRRSLICSHCFSLVPTDRNMPTYRYYQVNCITFTSQSFINTTTIKAVVYWTLAYGSGVNRGTAQSTAGGRGRSHKHSSRLPLLPVRPVVTFSAAEHHRTLAGTKLYCLVTEAHECEQFAPSDHPHQHCDGRKTPLLCAIQLVCLPQQQDHKLTICCRFTGDSS